MNLVLEYFFPVNRTSNFFAPDIKNSMLAYFVVFPIFLIISNFIDNSKVLNKRNKTIAFILVFLIFSISYHYYLPNRDIRF